jgi:DHA2 family multidrug resistance protein
MATQAITAPGGRAPAAPVVPTAPAGMDPADALSFQFRWIILIGLVTAAIMEVLDTTIINVALPQMAGNLGSTLQEIGWVSTGYILSNVVVLPMTAFLATTFGRKRYLMFSTGLFIVASFLCGTSHSLGEIVLWRIMQGVGGAALLSTAQAALRQIFPREQQGVVQAVFLLGIVVAPTIGPTLGGWITDNYTWNWCFFINVPIGIASLALVGTFLHDPKVQRERMSARDVDWLGIGLLAVGLGSLQYVLEEGNQNDWFEDAWITRLAILSGVCIVSLLAWEMWPGNKRPVVNFRVLKNRELASSLFLFVSLGFGLYGGIFIFPQFTQNILGLSPTATGLVLLPGGVATAVGVVICGRLLNGAKPLVDARLLILFGVGLFMLSMWDLGHLTTASGEPDTRFALIIRGFGLGFLFTPINLAAFANLKPQEIQQGSGLVNLTRQLGGSFGIAVLGTYVQNQTVYHRTNISSYLSAGNGFVIDRLHVIAANLVAHGYAPVVAQSVALGELNGIVSRQAATESYNDAFLLILLVFVCTSPAVLLLRPPKGKSAAAAAAAAGGH